MLQWRNSHHDIPGKSWMANKYGEPPLDVEA